MVPSTSTIDRFLSYILRLAVLFTCHDDYADDHRLTDSHAAVDFGISPLPSQSCMGELRIEETRPDHSLPLGLVKKKSGFGRHAEAANESKAFDCADQGICGFLLWRGSVLPTSAGLPLIIISYSKVSRVRGKKTFIQKKLSKQLPFTLHLGVLDILHALLITVSTYLTAKEEQ